MSLIISFSGGCFSGKTTAIESLQKILGKEHCVVIGEAIRGKKIGSIDELRKSPEKYLKIQQEIIYQKISEEKKISAQSKLSDKVILIDRALSDSMFYLTFYLDKSNLSQEQLDLYAEIYHHLNRSARFSFNNIYDIVLQFQPLNIPCDDVKFRPGKMETLKQIESDTIQLFSRGYNQNKIIHVNMNVEPDLITNILLNRKVKFPKSYQEYKDFFSKYYSFDNLVTNSVYSIEVDKIYSTNAIMSACLYSFDKMASDTILKGVSEIKTEDSFMNSRCYPTGVFEVGNTMFVGEAPGQSGRAIDNNGMKPSFIFEQTSYLLRKAIFDNIDNLDNKVPYITNLLKYAKKDNAVSASDFNLSFNILEEEIRLIKPKRIVALGESVYKYLSNNIDSKYKQVLVKMMHPTGATYKNMGAENYSQELLKTLR